MNILKLPLIACAVLATFFVAAVAPPVTPTATPTQTTPQSAPAQKDSAKSKPSSTSASTKSKKPKREAGLIFGIAKAPPKAAGTIRLGAYNIENFFDGVDDPNLSGEYDDIKMQTSEDRCKSLAKAIHDLDADVLCLEEVEGEDALRWFRDTYLKDMGYEYLASKEVGYYRGVEQSLLSRFPIKDVQVWTSEDLAPMEKYIPKDTDQRKKEGWGDDPKEKEPLKFQRSPLKVAIQLSDETTLTVYVLHHKAGGKATAHHRELEALRINEMVKADLAKNADALLAVVGDFNATPMEKAAKLYRDKAFAGLVSAYEFRPEAGQAKDKKSAANDSVDAGVVTDESNEANADESAATTGATSQGGGKVTSADKKAAKNLYLTHITNRSIDYILLSPALVKLAVPKSFFVLGTLMPGSDYDYKKDEPPAGYASDHCPIAVDLKVATTKAAKPKTDAPAPPAAKEVAK
ncbi:MAG: hypothetical protein EXS12_01130 [Phycisphaerales bacterium]|nr:hypothetical protein [Phycisphaerales bacterium]